jgi:RNA polymerase sigma-70 factor (ECF subfamily)
LEPKYREVIHLFYYEDLSVEEIGKVLNRKKSTVRTQLTRARAMLRSILEEDCDV